MQALDVADHMDEVPADRGVGDVVGYPVRVRVQQHLPAQASCGPDSDLPELRVSDSVGDQHGVGAGAVCDGHEGAVSAQDLPADLGGGNQDLLGGLLQPNRAGYKFGCG